MLFAFVLVMGCYAAPKKVEKANNFVNSVSTVHDDVKDIVSTVHEDTKSIITTLYGDSKTAAKDLYPDVKSAVIAIGQGIGVAAEHVYNVLVKKYIVEGLVQLIPFLIGLALLIVGWIKAEKYIKTHEQIKWAILYPVFLLIIGGICLLNVDYNTMFMGLINPEFGAINYILDFTKDMVK